MRYPEIIFGRCSRCLSSTQRAQRCLAALVYRRKARGKKSARLLIKCGDCDQKFEIHYGPEGEDLEIAGVLASVENWREILLPLLKNSRGK